MVRRPVGPVGLCANGLLGLQAHGVREPMGPWAHGSMGQFIDMYFLKLTSRMSSLRIQASLKFEPEEAARLRSSTWVENDSEYLIMVENDLHGVWRDL